MRGDNFACSFIWGITMTRYLYWLPFCIVLAWCGKNMMLFGNFGTSSWLPMSLYKTTLWGLPQAERDSLAHAGIISGFSTQEPVARIWRYGVPTETHQNFRLVEYPATPRRFVPVLDVSEFPMNGSNLNHWVYLVVAKTQMADVKWALWNHPEILMRTAWASFKLTFKPASSFFYYTGHLGRRRHNADIVLSTMCPWVDREEYSFNWAPDGRVR